MDHHDHGDIGLSIGADRYDDRECIPAANTGQPWSYPYGHRLGSDRLCGSQRNYIAHVGMAWRLFRQKKLFSRIYHIVYHSLVPLRQFTLIKRIGWLQDTPGHRRRWFDIYGPGHFAGYLAA